MQTLVSLFLQKKVNESYHIHTTFIINLHKHTWGKLYHRQISMRAVT